MSLVNKGRKTDVEYITIVTFTCDACMQQIRIADPEPMDYCPFCGRK
jgi:hypothetical protein